jgi:hypothetical protein
MTLRQAIAPLRNPLGWLAVIGFLATLFVFAGVTP